MFNKLFSGQGAAFKMAVCAAIPFIAMWVFFKTTPVRPVSIPTPSSVTVDTSSWYNPFSWGRDVAANEAANQSLTRTAAYVQQAREADSAGITSLLLTVALVAAVGAVAGKILEMKVPHPQIESAANVAADKAADRALSKYTPQLAPSKSAAPAPAGLTSKAVTA
jgi:hypothetical protein